MTEIVPAINAENIEEIKRKVKLVEPYVRWAHIDIADGSFTPNVLWHNPKELAQVETHLFLEAHLMLDNIDEKIGEWAASPAQRIIFHIESSKDPAKVIAACRLAKKEVGIAVLPATELSVVMPFCHLIDLVQLLAVSPGRAGQVWDEGVLRKIRFARDCHSASLIEVDGGMKVGTARLAAEAGADIIVAASAIFGSEDVKTAIEALRKDVSGS